MTNPTEEEIEAAMNAALAALGEQDAGLWSRGTASKLNILHCIVSAALLAAARVREKQ